MTSTNDDFGGCESCYYSSDRYSGFQPLSSLGWEPIDARCRGVAGRRVMVKQPPCFPYR